jgi:hypothetical protein
MIYEIRIQHVEPEKRDEYIRVFGDILRKPTTLVCTALNCSPVSKTQVG